MAKNSNCYCPVCGSKAVERGGILQNQKNNLLVDEECHCVDCGAEWINDYELVGFSSLKKL